MSLVLAVNCRVRDFDAWWATIANEIQDLIELHAKYLVVYRSADDPDRIFATISFDEPGSVQGLMRSPSLLRWFDSTGIEDVPPIFVGHQVEKIDLRKIPEQHPEPAGFLVASFVVVDSVDRLRRHAHSASERMQVAGVRRYWIHQALDDGNEIMIMRDIATRRQARRWLLDPELSVTAGKGTKFMVYPPPFVGSFVRAIDVRRAVH